MCVHTSVSIRIYLKCLTHFGNLQWAPLYIDNPGWAQSNTHSHTHTRITLRTAASPLFNAPPGIWLLVVFVFASKPKSLSAFVAAGSRLSAAVCRLPSCCLFFLRALCFPIRLLTIKSKIASGILCTQTLKENQAQISAAWPVVPVAQFASPISPCSPARQRAPPEVLRPRHTHKIIITYWFRLQGKRNFKLKHHQLFMSSPAVVAFSARVFFSN